MTNVEAIAYMENEIACINKSNDCNRDCLNCKLVVEVEPLLEAYKLAIQALETGGLKE